jgi:hypothetical protein
MWNKRLMWVIWPAFLVAGLLEMLVFAMVDPQHLHWAGQSLELSNQAVYTVAFFLFWLLAMLASGLTALLAMAPDEVNQLPADTSPPGR